MIKLLKKLKPFRLQILFVVILIFLQAMSELFLPNIMSDIVDVGIVNQDTGYIIGRGLIMLAIGLAAGLFTVTASYISSKVAMGYGRDLRKLVFSRVESYSLQEFDKIGTASLINRTTNDINQMQNTVMIMLRLMLYAPLIFVGGIIMAMRQDAKLALTLVVALPVLAFVVLFIVRKGIPLFKKVQKKLDNVNLVFRENLTGVRVIRAFNKTDHEDKRFNTANMDLTKTSLKVNRIISLLNPIMALLINLVTIAVVWFGGLRIDAGFMQVGDLMAFIQYIMRIMFSLVMLSMMFIFIPRASASAERINEVLDMHPEINDPDNPITASKKKGYVEFKNVSFIYPGAEQPALNNISFTAGPGETTAIIGSTGSGKSTLINMIPRFFEATSGQVIINGVPVNQMTQAHLRSKIGFVPQKSSLFTGSVNYNIRFGKEDASQTEIEKAVTIAQAKDFVDEREGDFESIISQGGSNLSGGQKQRLSIARALVRRPEIYVFDDSFSALDFKTESKLRTALDEETKESTVFVVSQRVNSIMNSTRIIVLDQGNVCGIGTHKELLETCSVYREIVSSQLSEEEMA